MKTQRKRRSVGQLVGGFFLFAFFWLFVVVRIIRQIHKFPMPEFMAPVIDNPLRHKIQPASTLAVRHGLQPGMRVLEVGPGNGTYTFAAARQVSEAGKVVAIDIEPKMIDRVTARAAREGVHNVEARLANVYALPFEDGTFDAIYMVTVIGEIPEPGRAMREFYRVLAPSGTLAFSELLLDPDYPLARTTVNLAQAAGFRLRQKYGRGFTYTLVFEKER
jgi:ubiquinone/menaquinone biosynthesis C-methylase UbiE